MATSIYKLSGTDVIVEDDLLPIWVDLQGDTRKVSIGRLTTYLEQNLNILGTGATTLNELTNVTVPAPLDGQVLQYNGNSSQWVAATLPSGGATDLNSLSDVTVGSSATGQVLVYNGSVYVNRLLSAADITSGTFADARISETSVTQYFTSPTITLTGDVSGTATLVNLTDASLNVTIADDSHNHIIGNVDGLQAALDLKAPLASPNLTGVPTAPTATSGTDTDQIATTSFVNQVVSGLGGTVTSVSGTGSVNGIGLSGTVTSSGSLTLSGTLAISDNDWSGAALSIANGGTGATNAGAARAALGLVLGADVQPYNAKLSDIATLPDPNEDRLLFWDETINEFRLLELGTGLSITGTVLNASATGSGTVTSVAATGSIDGLTLTATGTTDVTVTLGGSISITESQISDFGTYLTAVPAEYLTQTEGDARYLQTSLTSGQVYIGNLSNQATARALAQSDIANLSTDLAAKLDTSAYTASDVLTKLKTVDGTGSLLDADLLDGQQGIYYLDYTNFTNTPTIPTNNNQLTNGAGYITTYTVTQSDVTQHQAALSITESQISDLGNYSAVTSGAGAPSSTPTALGDIYIDTTNDDAYIAVGTASAADWEKSNDGTGTGGGGGTVTSVSGTGTVSGISLSGTVTTSGSLTLGGTLAADTSNITTGTFADARIAQSNVTQHQAALSITESQISDLGTYLTGNQTITLSGDVSGSGTTSIVVTVADDSHNHVISNVDGLQTALDAKAPLASPALTGTPTAPTAATATNTTQIATTAFVKAQGYLTSFTETNDLTAAVTWANVPNANITQSSVTQHQAALSITESQISDFGTYATLVGGTVPASQLPSFVDDVVEAAGTGNFPATGEADKIYVDTSANKTYRWSGTQYVEISASPGSTDEVTEGSTNLYFTNARARAAISVSGSLSYDSGTGVISYTQPTNVSTFTNDSGYITASSTATLTNKSGNISQWTNDSGYLTSETSHADVVVDGDFASQGLMRRGATAGSYSIITDNSGNWNTAFGWGDHAAAGYVTASSTATFTNKSGNISQWTNDSGYTTNTGTVTSVGGTGTVNGLTLTGTVTTSGNLTLGGSVSGGLTGVTSIYNTSLAVGRSASTERIDFGTSGQIGVYLANVEEFRFAAGGTFHADADVVAFSTTVASDEKLKHNIHPITDALEKVQNLTGVTFQYRRDNKQSAGVIAQAVERVMPSAVKEVAHLNDEGTYKSVDYNQLIGLLIEAVKDQQQQIDKLQRMLGA